MNVERDEREQAIDLSADRAGYLVATYGMLGLVLARAMVHGEAAWDLMGLVVLSGIASFGYRAWRGTVSRRLMAATVVVLVSGALVAAVVAVATRAI